MWDKSLTVFTSSNASRIHFYSIVLRLGSDVIRQRRMKCKWGQRECPPKKNDSISLFRKCPQNVNAQVTGPPSGRSNDDVGKGEQGRSGQKTLLCVVREGMCKRHFVVWCGGLVGHKWCSRKKHVFSNVGTSIYIWLVKKQSQSFFKCLFETYHLFTVEEQSDKAWQSKHHEPFSVHYKSFFFAEAAVSASSSTWE